MAEERIHRRLSAILAADVVGYSRLMGEDEAGTLAALNSHRTEFIHPTVSRYGGRIVKLMGDGALVEFPSVVDAVESAVAVQRGMEERNAEIPDGKRITFRIGINLGDVIIDGDDIYGDGVNVAARLEALAKPGSICISDIVHQSVEGKLNLTFADMGTQQVKNIAKPVRAYQVILSDAADRQLSNQPPSERISIAVLPFDNMSGDAEQEYFSDGMAEDLITDLSKISGLSVATRNASFSFKGQMPNIQEVVDKLGVVFVLEGSVRKMGDRLRINAQLINGADNQHIWAERYDGNMAEIFDFQDRIQGEIIAALELKLTPGEKVRSGKRQTENVEAYDLYLKGRERYFRYTPDALSDAFDCLKRAIELDPEFSDAYGYLSYCYFAAHMMGWSGVSGTLEQALDAAETAVSLDTNSALAHTRLGWILGFLRRFEEAIKSFETALSLEPDLAEVYAYYGEILNFAGDPEKGLQYCERALQLDPYAPIAWKFHFGQSYYDLGRFKESITILQGVVKEVPRFFIPRLFLACAYVEDGQLETAQELISEAKFSDDFFPEFAKKWPGYKNEEDQKRVYDSLRKVGLSADSVDLEEVASMPLSDKPSIAVLPFANMSGDPEQEPFADGMTDDMITDLSKISGLFVVASNTSFAYKGKPADVRDTAQELGVRYILEGSVRKSGGRVRINAQLIDAITGGHLWADRYDGELSDAFALQDEVGKQVVEALAVRLQHGEEARLQHVHTRSVEAYEQYVLAKSISVPPIKARLAQARDAFSRAIEIDPEFAGGYAGVSAMLALGALYGQWDEPNVEIDRAVEFARKGIEVDDTFGWSHTALGIANLARREFDAAVSAAEEGERRQPGDADTLAYLGLCLIWVGRAREAIERINRALSLNTHVNVPYYYFLLLAHFTLGEYAEAVAAFEANIHRGGPTALPGNCAAAAAYAAAGESEKAERMARLVLEEMPDFTVSGWRRPYWWKEQANNDQFLSALIDAGLPE